MTYRSILTVVDGSRWAEHRARVAAGLAARFGARLTGAFPRPAPPVSAWDQPLDWGLTPSIPPALSPEAVAAHERRSDAQAEDARMAFEAAADQAGCRSDWMTIPGASAAGVLQLMRRTDLSILPTGRLPTLGETGTTAADLVLDSGGPALLLPDRAAAPLPGRRVLVAWNGSREAARALRDAWPFLTIAESVRVALVRSAEAEEPDSLLQRYFEDHGREVELVVVREPDAGVADALRAEAEALGADLIVMGLYGRSRLRETILGGVSRSLLDSAGIPILATH
ncbi:universal stress protein [Brevundimonas sp.]|uniref:universal stress protein n=1 Tax=Brevundimonas sp. TaxID=1871086 RepID=UPI0035B39C2C